MGMTLGSEWEQCDLWLVWCCHEGFLGIEIKARAT